jgi:hypothetical protein
LPRAVWRAFGSLDAAQALAALDEGDTLMVVRLDRLARSTRDLLNILHELGDKGASFQEPARLLGRHHHAAWPVDAHHLGRSGRVRAQR